MVFFIFLYIFIDWYFLEGKKKVLQMEKGKKINGLKVISL